MYTPALVGSMMIAALWGLTPVIHKHVLKDTDGAFVMVAGGVAYMLCLAVYATWHWPALRRQWSRVSAATLFWVAAAAIVTGFLANMMYFAVLPMAPSHIVSALVYSAPLFTLLFASVFLQERVSVTGALGVGLIVAGVGCLACAKGGV